VCVCARAWVCVYIPVPEGRGSERSRGTPCVSRVSTQRCVCVCVCVDVCWDMCVCL
jgi:hypothetical protein